MKNSIVKKALFTSAFAMIVCFTMLLGTTYAYFTDSAVSEKNKIVSGNLDISLYKLDDTLASPVEVTSTTNVFDGNRYIEPGYEEIVYFKVVNDGNLSLKYKLSVNVIENVIGKNIFDENIDLTKLVKYGITLVEDGQPLTAEKIEAVKETAQPISSLLCTDYIELDRAAGRDAEVYDVLALVVYMDDISDDNGNTTHNGTAVPYVDFGINLLAAQGSAEADGFADSYDKDADVDLSDAMGYGDNAAYYNGQYYSTLNNAILAANTNASASPAMIYCAPDAVLEETFTHVPVTTDIIIYGNGATLVNGERDISIDYNAALTKDINIEVYDLNGIGIWGQRTSDHTVTASFYNCKSMSKVYFTGTTGINNTNINKCTFEKETASSCTVYSNADGVINISDTTFTGVAEPVNLNHKASGVQTVNIDRCSFIDCGNTTLTSNEWVTSVRVLSTEENAKTVLSVKNTTFTPGEHKINGDIMLNDTITVGEDKVKGTVEANIVPVGESDISVIVYSNVTVTGIEDSKIIKRPEVTQDV